MPCFLSKLYKLVAPTLLLLAIPCFTFGDLVMTVTEVGDDLHFNHSGATLDTSVLTIGGGLATSTVVYGTTHTTGAWSGGPESLRNWQGVISNTVSSGWTANGTLESSWDNSPTGHGFLVSAVFDVFWIHDVTLSVQADSVTLDAFHGILLDRDYSDFGWTEGESVTSSWSTDSITFQIGAVAVPEPSTPFLVGASMFALGCRRRRRSTHPG